MAEPRSVNDERLFGSLDISTPINIHPYRTAIYHACPTLPVSCGHHPPSTQHPVQPTNAPPKPRSTHDNAAMVDVDDQVPSDDNSFGSDFDAVSNIYDIPDIPEHLYRWRSSSQMRYPSHSRADLVSSEDDSFGSGLDDDIPETPEYNPPSHSRADLVSSDDDSFGSDLDDNIPETPEYDPPFHSRADLVPADDDSFGSDFEDNIPETPEYNPPSYSKAASTPTPSDRLAPSSSWWNVLRKSRKPEPVDLQLPLYARQGMMCEICKLRPVYSNGQHSIPTCDHTCTQKLNPASIPRSTIMQGETQPPRSPQVRRAGIFEEATSPSSSGGSPWLRPMALLTDSYRSRGAAPSTNSKSHSMGQYRERLNLKTDPPPSSGGSPWLRPVTLRTDPYRSRGAAPSTSSTSHSMGQYRERLNLKTDLPSSAGRSPRAGRSTLRTGSYHGRGAAPSVNLTSHFSQGPLTSADPNNCDYCHRRPKLKGYNQCGKTCGERAKLACLLCKSRPKFKQYHLCGKMCMQIAAKSTPLILEVPPGHATYEMVKKKFKRAWKFSSNACPPIKRIYKIIEGKNFHQPYDRYKQRVGNEVFRYHGTTRKCTLGSAGNTKLCSNTSCPLCCILRTSFKTSLADPSGAFGPGVYSSSASNKAYSYTGRGTRSMLLTKVVLGKVRYVNAWNEVMSCPAGFNSVVFDRLNGALNETIVYSDNAIRPVFLIIF